jgi:hypothetical protein
MMTEKELDALIDAAIDARLNFNNQKPKPANRFLNAIRRKLSEQGTQRGLTLLLPIFIVRYFKLDPQTAIDVVTGILCIYGAHNVATEG